MRALFWNIRGFGHMGRRTLLEEYMRKEDVDIVGLQETIKTDFHFHELLSLDPLERFEWHFTPAVGRSGGMLMGLSRDVYDIISWDRGSFFLAAHFRIRATLRELVVIQVYGPANHSRSAEFLGELQQKVTTVTVAAFPVLVGGF